MIEFELKNIKPPEYLEILEKYGVLFYENNKDIYLIKEENQFVRYVKNSKGWLQFIIKPIFPLTIEEYIKNDELTANAYQRLLIKHRKFKLEKLLT